MIPASRASVALFDAPSDTAMTLLIDRDGEVSGHRNVPLSDFRKSFAGEDNGGCMEIPLRVQDSEIGSLCLNIDGQASFEPEHESIAREVAGPLAIRHPRRKTVRGSGCQQKTSPLSLSATCPGPGAGAPQHCPGTARRNRPELDRAEAIIGNVRARIRFATGRGCRRGEVNHAQPARPGPRSFAGSPAGHARRPGTPSGVVSGSPIDIRGKPESRWISGIPGLEVRFDPEAETAAFRIVQEALTNIARHSGSQRADVRVVAASDALVVTVEDEGVGFVLQNAIEAGASSGLSGMQERVSLLGGNLTIDTGPDRGTSLTAEFPLNGKQETS